MDKPTSVDERREWTQRDGLHYTRHAPPPWEPGDGQEGWTWKKTIFGDWFEREPNLPYCCDPSFERYWCM